MLALMPFLIFDGNCVEAMTYLIKRTCFDRLPLPS